MNHLTWDWEIGQQSHHSMLNLLIHDWRGLNRWNSPSEGWEIGEKWRIWPDYGQSAGRITPTRSGNRIQNGPVTVKMANLGKGTARLNYLRRTFTPPRTKCCGISRANRSKPCTFPGWRGGIPVAPTAHAYGDCERSLQTGIHPACQGSRNRHAPD